MGLISFGDDNVASIPEAKSDVIITPLDDSGSPVNNGSIVLQYFPETINDNKSVNLQTKEVPGGSLPLYQWMSASERTIGFTAIFTSDVDHIASAASTTTNWLSAETPLQHYQRVKDAGLERRNVDARTAIVYLRSFLLPRYSSANPDNNVITRPPPTLRLLIPGSAIGLTGGITGAGHGPDSISCVMTECSVTYQKFFPSGFPRIVEVGLSFAQVPNVGTSIVFPNSPFGDSTSFDLLSSPESVDPGLLPYTLRPRKKATQ